MQEPRTPLFLFLPVKGDGGQGEAAGIHGEVDEEVDSLAHEGPEHPSLQRVDGGLERDAEEDEAEVSHPQVEDEEVGCVLHLPIAQQHGQDQAVAHRAHEEDDEVHEWDDHGLGLPAPPGARQRAVHGRECTDRGWSGECAWRRHRGSHRVRGCTERGEHQGKGRAQRAR